MHAHTLPAASSSSRREPVIGLSCGYCSFTACHEVAGSIPGASTFLKSGFDLTHYQKLGSYLLRKQTLNRLQEAKGPFVNYVRVPGEGGGLEKSLHTLTLRRGKIKLILT